MKRKLCCAVFLVVCLAAVLVQSETTIERDENGDEYEVKRFNIQGRSLNEGRSQCVTTRRKRATYNNDNSDEDNRDTEILTSPTTPVSGVDTETAMDGDYDENEDNLNINFNGNLDNKDSNEEEAAQPDKEGEEEGNDDNDNDDENDDEDEQIATIDGEDYDEDYAENHQLPLVVAHHQSSSHLLPSGLVSAQHQSSSHVLPSGSVAATAGATATNGIVVVQTNTPPKVNPDTHAVFELLPVNPATWHGDDGADDGDDNDDQFHYEEEISPVSTTAIWSTGDDGVSDDLYDDYDLDEKPVKGSGIKKPSRKPSKGNKKPAKNNKNKNKKKKNKSKNKIKKNKKGNNKVRPTKNKNKRKPINKRRRPGNKNRPLKNKRRFNNNNNTNKKRVKLIKRRRPNIGNQTRRKNTNNLSHKQNMNRKRNQNQNFNKNFNHRVNANLSNRNTNRKKLDKLENVNQGTRTYTMTNTMTQTGTANDDKDVNCIIIHKDPPPTTPRPFWQILGRDAEGEPTASRQFGKRKRVNMRFVA